MKIIGFSDVITNSSSEVFTIYNEYGINLIKDLVNAVLKSAESDKVFDDLFTIELTFDRNEVLEYYLEDNPNMEEGEVSDKELLNYALVQDKGYTEWPLVTGFNITAKDSRNKESARLLNSIDDIFDHNVRY